MVDRYVVVVLNTEGRDMLGAVITCQGQHYCGPGSRLHGRAQVAESGGGMTLQGRQTKRGLERLKKKTSVPRHWLLGNVHVLVLID